MNINPNFMVGHHYSYLNLSFSYNSRYFMTQLVGARGAIPTNIYRKYVCDYQNLVNYQIDDDDLNDGHGDHARRKEKLFLIIPMVRVLTGVEAHLLAHHASFYYNKRKVFKMCHRDNTVVKCENN